MLNMSLKEQLQELKAEGMLKVRYPKGYKQWKAKFDYWFNITNDLQQTLNIMYGVGGGVNNYRGSLYCNSGFVVPVKKSHRKNKAKKRKEK